ncbi:DNA-binding protein [Salmonella enterica]|nr:DNA-binding protein [Salmonella enterica]
MPNQIPLDPKLPANFDNTPNDARSKAQLDTWWDHPYGITQPDGSILVRCLNGGAWDRSTVLGKATSYEEACVLAEEKQAEWVKRRMKPVMSFSLNPPYELIRMPQRPDQEPVIVGTFDTKEGLEAFKGA